MANGLMVDPSLTMAQAALQGLNTRQNVISQNISNVDTPGYKAQDVNFETTLQNAINVNNSIPMTVDNERHISGLLSETNNMYEVGLREGGSARADGNDVNIDQELEQMSETGIDYSALSSAISKKFSLIKAIIQ